MIPRAARYAIEVCVSWREPMRVGPFDTEQTAGGFADAIALDAGKLASVRVLANREAYHAAR